MKFCSSCQTEKETSEFYPDKTKGFSTYCKECSKIRAKEYISKNKEKHKLWSQTHYNSVKESENFKEKKKLYLEKTELQRSEVSKKYREESVDKIRDSYYKTKYGISLSQYEDLLKSQNYSCFICERPESQFKKRLCVDHNHKTGEVRGLLCDFCNHRLIGRHTNPELFEKAASYLKQGTGWFVPIRKKKRKRK